MIKYDLICKNEHTFEAWFDNYDSSNDQLAEHAVECPVCGDTWVSRAIVAPNISKKGYNSRSVSAQAREEKKAAMDWIARNCDDVGDKFADEVRAMHYGDAEERNIQGTASHEDAKELQDEGIDIINLGSKESEH